MKPDRFLTYVRVAALTILAAAAAILMVPAGDVSAQTKGLGNQLREPFPFECAAAAPAVTAPVRNPSGLFVCYTIGSGIEVDHTARVIRVVHPEIQPLPAFVYGITPTGAIDGTNRTFTLPAAPNPSGSLELFRNGVLQNRAATGDYTLAGATITFNAAYPAPQPGDVLLASEYRTQ